MRSAGSATSRWCAGPRPSAGTADLPHALPRLAALDQPERPVDVVSAAWVVSALAAARPLADVERAPGRGAAAAARPRAARRSTRTLPARHALVPRPRRQLRRPGVPDPGAGPAAPQRGRPGGAGRRGHRGRGHLRRPGRGRPVVVALRLADRRGRGGLPGVQRAPARDGADGAAGPGRRGRRRAPGRDPARPALAGRPAGGPGHGTAAGSTLAGSSRRSTPARRRSTVQLVLDDPPITWRKVARAITARWSAGCGPRPPGSSPAPGSRCWTGSIPPGVVDHECRPYELGWLLYTWLS